MSIKEFLKLINNKCLRCGKDFNYANARHYSYNHSVSLECSQCFEIVIASERDIIVFIDYWFDDDVLKNKRLTLRDDALEWNDIPFFFHKIYHY